jgi:hypothetical protein
MLSELPAPVEMVRSRPEMYFPPGKRRDIRLAQGVSLDAMLSGCREIVARNEGDVWVIAASANWLRHEAISGPALFERIISLAPVDPNGMRTEIVLNAFCTEVVAVVGSEVVFEKSAVTVKPVLAEVFRKYSELCAGIGFRI